MSSLYDELFPHFPSSQFAHVGLDETFDLGEKVVCVPLALNGTGKGRSAKACEQEGKNNVYLYFFNKVTPPHGLFIG